MQQLVRTITTDALPPLGTLHFQGDELSVATASPRRRFALVPLLASVCLHALGLYGLIEFRIETPQRRTATPLAIHVQLLPQPRTRAPDPPQTLAIEPTNTAASDRPTSATTAPPALGPPRVDVPQLPETSFITAPVTTPSLAPETRAPSRLSILQMVDKLRSEEERQAVLLVCTPAQKRNPMLLCADEYATAFDEVQRDVGNTLFAASAASGEGAASAQRVQRISNSLRDSGMSQGDIDRYIEEIDVSAQQRSTSGDARARSDVPQRFNLSAEETRIEPLAQIGG